MNYVERLNKLEGSENLINIEFSEGELDLMWNVLVNESCLQFIGMQKSKSAKDLLDHKNRKELCDMLISKSNPYKKIERK